MLFTTLYMKILRSVVGENFLLGSFLLAQALWKETYISRTGQYKQLDQNCARTDCILGML